MQACLQIQIFSFSSFLKIGDNEDKMYAEITNKEGSKNFVRKNN